MSKKKSVLMTVIALILGLAIGVGATLGVTHTNQTGTITDNTGDQYSITTTGGTTTVTVYNWSHVGDVEIMGSSDWYLFPRSVCNYLKETYEIYISTDDDGLYVSSYKEIESKDTDSDFHEYYSYSKIVTDAAVDEGSDTLTFSFATAQTELTFNVYVCEMIDESELEDVAELEPSSPLEEGKLASE